MAESPLYEPIDVHGRRSTNTSQSVCVSTRLCLVVLILSVVGNVLFIGFLIHKTLHIENSESHTEQQLSPKDVSGALCVSCDSLHVPDPTKAPFITQIKVTDLGQRSRLCCQKHSEGLSRLINLLVGQYYSHKHGSYTNQVDLSTHNTAAAHVYLDIGNVKDQRLSWDSELGYGTGHQTGGITYRNGSILVPHDGVYNVYSFLTLEADDVTAADLNHVHSVSCYNPSQPNRNKLLLLNKVSHETQKGRLTTSFLAANLKLRKNDEVFVEFSNPSMVYKFPPSNYFGVYEL